VVRTRIRRSASCARRCRAPARCRSDGGCGARRRLLSPIAMLHAAAAGGSAAWSDGSSPTFNLSLILSPLPSSTSHPLPCTLHSSPQLEIGPFRLRHGTATARAKRVRAYLRTQGSAVPLAVRGGGAAVRTVQCGRSSSSGDLLCRCRSGHGPSIETTAAAAARGMRGHHALCLLSGPRCVSRPPPLQRRVAPCVLPLLGVTLRV